MMEHPEQPETSRVQFYSDERLFQVRVNSRRNVALSLFLAVWLCGWAVGLIAALGAVFGGEAGAPVFFLLVWMTLWLLGGALAGVQLAWMIMGYELLTLSGDALTIERYISRYRRTWRFQRRQVANVRVDLSNPVPHHPTPGPTHHGEYRNRHGRTANLPGFLSGIGAGSVKFDSGTETIGFGFQLDEAEAQQVVKELTARLGAV